MIEPLRPTATGARDQMLEFLRKLILDGLEHGFFLLDCV
jgi:hypothetical protein